MSAWGVLPEDLDQTVEVWEQHWQAVELFCQMMTQWRVGASGVVGLDYLVLFRLMDNQGFDKQQQNQLMEQIRVMESAALSVIYSE